MRRKHVGINNNSLTESFLQPWHLNCCDTTSSYCINFEDFINNRFIQLHLRVEQGNIFYCSSVCSAAPPGQQPKGFLFVVAEGGKNVFHSPSIQQFLVVQEIQFTNLLVTRCLVLVLLSLLLR